MHLFDTLVNAPVAASSSALAAGAFAYASYRSRRTLPRSRTPMLGLSAAFIFAAQMLNFPIPGGASGHLLGAALAAVLLGPSAAIVAMSAVVILQCFLFADGGVSTLGANVFNMAVVGVVVAYACYRGATALLGKSRAPIAAGIAAWCSVVVASAICGGQIALSGHGSPAVVIGGMVGIHAIIGIGEAVITTMVLTALQKARPDLLESDASTPPHSRLAPVAVYGLLVALGLAAFVSPFACPWPDGMETVVGRLGIDPATVEPIWRGLMPDYQWSGMPAGALSTALAGVIGTIAAFAMAWAAVRALTAARAKPLAEEVSTADNTSR